MWWLVMNQLQYLFQQRRQFCLCWWPSLLSTPSLMFPWPAWTPWNQCCRCHLGQKCWKSDNKIKDEILGGRSSGLANDFQMEHFVKKTKQVADLVNKDRCLWSRHHHGIEADHLSLMFRKVVKTSTNLVFSLWNWANFKWCKVKNHLCSPSYETFFRWGSHSWSLDTIHEFQPIR